MLGTFNFQVKIGNKKCVFIKVLLMHFPHLMMSLSVISYLWIILNPVKINERKL